MTRTVLHVMGSLNRGGAESVALDLVRAIPADDVRQVFVCWSGERGTLASEFERQGAVVVALNGGLLQRLRAYWHLLRVERPDAVQAHLALSSAWFLAVARAGGVKVRVARVHSQGDGQSDSLQRATYRWAARRILWRSATHVLAVSQAALGFAAGPRGEVRVPQSVDARVLPNGVDLERFVPTQRSRTGPPSVLHVGRPDPAKNRRVLGSIARAVNTSRSVRFRLVGTWDTSDLGDERQFLEVEGPTSEIHRVYVDSDVLILPSKREGLPGVVLEALASGLPVIASDIASLRELATDLSGIRLVALDANPEVWAAAVLEALDAEQDGEVLAACIAESKFSLERNLQEWRKVWGA